jgi:PAS domain S-box-containing protein
MRWVRVIGHASKDKTTGKARLQGATQDITNSRQAMEQLRRFAERQATIFESITDAFFTVDRHWRFTYVNTRSEEVLRKSRDELLGHSLWELFPAAVGSEFERHYRHAMETGESVFFEARYEPLDNWLEVSAYPSEEGLAVYYRSIRERKEAQQKLQAAMEELERSNRELQDFAFVASHDLQEPLRKIQAFSDRLVNRSAHLSEQDRDYLARMQSAAGRMQQLIEDLLSYSRVTTRAKPMATCPTNTIVSEVLTDMEASIAREQAQVQVGELPDTLGDATQLRQVFQNLLSNAIKFHATDVIPDIKVYAEEMTDDAWTLVVSDNGIGFDERYAEKLFHPFQRLHQREGFAGTGIGMAIVKKILDRHGATVAVRSQPGAGTTFRIRLKRL